MLRFPSPALRTVLGLALVVAAVLLFTQPAVAQEREGAAPQPTFLDGPGWEPVASGVWQRSENGVLTTVAEGRDGMVWAVAELEIELARLTRLYLDDPSDHHRAVLDRHLEALETARGFLAGDRPADGPRTRTLAAQQEEEAHPPCTGYYWFNDAEADAYGTTWGGYAEASAYWSGRVPTWCTGNAYARAEVEVTTNGVTVTDLQTCYDPGYLNYGASCSATASLSGSSTSSCFSEGYAYTQSTSMAFFVSQLAQDGNC